MSKDLREVLKLHNAICARANCGILNNRTFNKHKVEKYLNPELLKNETPKDWSFLAHWMELWSKCIYTIFSLCNGWMNKRLVDHDARMNLLVHIGKKTSESNIYTVDPLWCQSRTMKIEPTLLTNEDTSILFKLNAFLWFLSGSFFPP